MVGKVILVVVFSTPALLAGVTVYDVDPYTNLNDSIATVIQTWIATCDSAVSVYFFAGRSPQTIDNYRLQIYCDGQAIPNAWVEVNDDPEYQFVGGPLQSVASLVKGKEYELRITHTGNKKVNFYYNTTNPYWHGKITSPSGLPDSCDLAARIYGGMARPSKELFGTQSVIASYHNFIDTCDPWIEDSIPRDTANWETCIQRMEEAGITRDRLGHSFWHLFQYRDSTTFSWAWFDSLMVLYANSSIYPSYMFFCSATWASCMSDTGGGWTYVPGLGYKHAITAYPRNLYQPVLDSDSINFQNYYARYVYNVLKRYGPKGYSQNGERTGVFWDQHSSLPYKPLLHYDVWAESPANAIKNTGFWDTCWIDSSRAPDYYDMIKSLGRYESMCSVYVRMVAVSDSAAHYASDSAIILAPGPPHVLRDKYPNDSIGLFWVKKFYEAGGNQFCQGVNTHLYDVVRWFDADTADASIDTIRSIMKAHGEVASPYWCDEYGDGDGSNPPNNLHRSLAVPEAYATVLASAANPEGPLNALTWFCFTNRYHYIASEGYMGLTDDTLQPLEPWYAYQQVTDQLKDKHFCRRIFYPDVSDTILRVYEFEDDNGLKKYVCWRNCKTGGGALDIKLPVRSSQVDSILLATSSSPDSDRISAGYDGFLPISIDTLPVYFKEVDSTVICDLRVDSLWSEPLPLQDSVNFVLKASITNIGNEASPTDQYTLAVLFAANDTLALDSVAYTAVIDTGATVILATDSLLLRKSGGPYIIKSRANPYKEFNEELFTNNAAYRYYTCPKPPTGNITVNDGYDKTNLRYAVLKLQSFDLDKGSGTADSMNIYQHWVEGDSGITYNWKYWETGWIPFDTTYFYHLRQDSANNIVNVKYKVGEWNESKPYCGTILFDIYQPDSIFFEVQPYTNDPQVQLYSRLYDLSNPGRMKFGICDLETPVKNPTFDSVPPWDTCNVTYHDSLDLIELNVADSTSVYQVIDTSDLSEYLNDTLFLSVDLATGKFFGACSVCFIYRYDHPDDEDPPFGEIPTGCKIAIPEGSKSYSALYHLGTNFQYDPNADFIEAWVGIWGDVDSGRIVLDNLRLDPVKPEPEYTYWLAFDTLHTFTLPNTEDQYVISALYQDSSGVESWILKDTTTLDTTDPDADLTFPADSQQIADTIEIQGWAYDPNDHFEKYTLYFRPEDSTSWYGCNPDSASTSPVDPIETPFGLSGDSLGMWNTNQVTDDFGDGWYDLKLWVVDSAGNEDAETIAVNISNETFPGDGFGGMGAPGGLAESNSSIYAADLSGKVIHYDIESGGKIGEFPVEDSLGAGIPLGLFTSNYVWVVDEKHENLKGYQDGKVKKKIKVKEPEFITDGLWLTSGNQVLLVDEDGKIKAKVAMIGKPKGLCLHKGLLIVAQEKSSDLLVIDSSGTVVDTIPAHGLTDPFDLVADEHDFIYISDYDRIGLYDLDGSALYAIDAENPKWLERAGPYLFVSYADSIVRYRLFGGKKQGGGGGPQEGGLHYFYSFRCFPNPFPRTLNIVYSLAKKTKPKLVLYDVTGRRVRSYQFGEKDPGFHQTIIKPKLPNGVYFVNFEAGSFKKTDKVVLVR